MHTASIAPWRHAHTFGQERRRAGETRTLIVFGLTLVTMVVEVWAGIAFGSVALLADGLHLGSHAVALGIAFFAYAYARRRAGDPRFAFGTGKVNALGGFAGAILLTIFALTMAWEGFARLVDPVDIAFDWAIAVAVVGLVVNGVSILILGVREHDDGHHGGHGHSPAGHAQGPSHNHHHHHPSGQNDLNLRSAYLHVLADALTSVLAIVALLSGKYLGMVWMDPLMGLVGAVLVIRWSWQLMRDTSGKLLDHQAPPEIREPIRQAIEAEADNRIFDLHVWSVAPGAYAAIIGVVTRTPQPPDHYRALLPHSLGLAHVTIEVTPCLDGPDGARLAA
jgi:cation diffusion facilitator family transporter